jgi:5-methylcytosine-specific restriction enzyme subunit McrC
VNAVVTIELAELGEPVEVSLTTGQARLLAASGVVSVVPTLERSGRWLVGPAGKVGAARIGDATIRIRPKVEIMRLLFMLGYAAHASAWQPSVVELGTTDELVPAIAAALWRQLARALHQGLLPGYVTVEEASPVLRGRLRESTQLSARHGLPLPLEIRHDEFTVDIAENQILRTAAERMLLVPRVDDESQQMLRRLLRDFADVSSIPRGDPIPAWQPTRLNVRYHIALRLAELVLHATSVEHTTGTVAVNGFLIDMPQLFQDFVTVALREALEGTYGGRVAAEPLHHLDEAGRVRLYPDIVWQVGGSPRAVIDAKYKAQKPRGYPNADLYQLLAYCTVLGLRHGHLVYARGNEEPTRHVVRAAGVEIICHALDLYHPPDALLAEVRELARSIQSMSNLRFQRAAPLTESFPISSLPLRANCARDRLG